MRRSRFDSPETVGLTRLTKDSPKNWKREGALRYASKTDLANISEQLSELQKQDEAAASRSKGKARKTSDVPSLLNDYVEARKVLLVKMQKVCAFDP